MTIALSIKVHDGLVLAADSASTLMFGGTVTNVYNNANKIFNLFKCLPIGLMTWGAGAIGVASISTLAKDLRHRLMGQDQAWAIDRNNYTIQNVAEKVRRFFFEEHYQQNFVALLQPGVQAGQLPETGLLVAGYSSGAMLAEDWLVNVLPNAPMPVLPRAREHAGVLWYGDFEAVQRLMSGYGTSLPQTLAQMGFPLNQLPQAMATIVAVQSLNLAFSR